MWINVYGIKSHLKLIINPDPSQGLEVEPEVFHLLGKTPQILLNACDRMFSNSKFMHSDTEEVSLKLATLSAEEFDKMDNILHVWGAKLYNTDPITWFDNRDVALEYGMKNIVSGVQLQRGIIFLGKLP